MSNNYLSDLNKEQRRAVRHGTKQPKMIDRALLVIAGAGTGKTKTLTYRVAHLIVNGVNPQRILLLTFTRRAAQEMTYRAEGIAAKALDGRPVELPWSGTFHHVGLRLLRKYAKRIGLHPSFTIHSRGESEDLMGMVREQLDLSKSKSRFPQDGDLLGHLLAGDQFGKAGQGRTRLALSRVQPLRAPITQVVQSLSAGQTPARCCRF